MKCIRSKPALFVACLVVALVLAASIQLWRSTRPSIHLAYSIESRTFRIVQIADIHLGEAADTEWGPEQDRKTWQALDRIFSYENADLIVLTGDQLTANNVRNNATAYYRILGERISKYQTPWALIFGNHDDADYEKDVMENNVSVIHHYRAQTSRRQLLQAIRPYPLSVTPSHPLRHVFGSSNYALDVYQGSAVATRFLLLDTGGGSLPKQVENDQISWLQSQLRNASLPALIFAHIPTRDFGYSDSCQGMQDDGVDAVDHDAGLVQALQQLPNVHLLAVGHNHGNDYCCALDQLHLCFGRHSGYGGYGSWERGARVYELQLDDNALAWKSWVRLESGEVVDEIQVRR